LSIIRSKADNNTAEDIFCGRRAAGYISAALL
jgi:hypothetical protein